MTYQKRKEMTDRHHTNHRMPLYRYHRPGVQLRLLCVFLTVLLVFNAVAIVPVIASDAPSTKEVHPDCFEFETYPEAVTNDKNDERLIRIDTDNDPLNVIKYYVGENNYESLVFPIDVKYIDENGIYKDKSNKLYESENVGLSYENRDNNIKAYNGGL